MKLGFDDVAATELMTMLEVMYLVATADGYFSIEERKEFLENAESLTEGKLDPAKLTAMIDSWVERGVGGDQWTRLVELSHALPDETSRRIALGLAMQIAEADGQFLDSEAALIDRMARAFGLDRADYDAIAHSVRMSRRPEH